MKVKMLQKVGECLANETYEIDDATAQSYCDLNICEKVETKAVETKSVDVVSEKVVKSLENVAKSLENVCEKSRSLPEIKVIEKKPTLGGFLKSVKDFACGNDRDKAAKYLEGNCKSVLGTEANWAIPVEVLNIPEILSAITFDESDIFGNYLIPYQMTTHELVVPQFTAQPAFALVARGNTPSETGLTPANVALTAKQGIGWLDVHNSQLLDAAYLDQVLTQMLYGSVGYWVNKHVQTGAGDTATEIPGICDHSATVKVKRQSATSYSIKDFTAMVAQNLSGNAEFWVSRDAWQYLANASVGDGTSAAAAAIQQIIKVGTNQADTICGRPVHISDYLSNFGSAKDVILMDWRKGYKLGMRQLEVGYSNQVSYKANMTTFRVVAELDGKPTLATPISINSKNCSFACQLDVVGS